MSVSFEEIHTEHLTLRIGHPSTMDEIFALPSELEQMWLLGIKDRRQLRIDQQKHKEGLSTHNRKFVHFFIYEKGGNEVIGWCGYHTWYTDHHRAELGYSFFTDEAKGKGWMSEVVAEVIPYGFDVMHLHRIEAMAGVESTFVAHFGKVRIQKRRTFARTLPAW